MCDDGNSLINDGCSWPECKIEDNYLCSGTPSECINTCGNGDAEPHEVCDDENFDNGDGCNEYCKSE